MKINNYFLLDTFTNVAFKGNPTPVCLLERPFPQKTMESLAKEFNAPVSVFISPENDLPTYQIRYFTIAGEIPACGHGTLGAAYVLFQQFTQMNSIDFLTIEGTALQSTQEEGITFIQYPKFEPTAIDIITELNEALEIKNHQSYFLGKELESLFIELENAEAVKKVKPNFTKLLQSTSKIKEVVIMSESDHASADFVLRSFCPWIGIDEDPVTGSIHSVLGHFWKEKLNKDKLIAHQVSERGGKIIVKPLDNLVKIGGDCKILIQGRLNL